MTKKKYIHTKQLEEYDCGIACVSSILKYYGHNYSMSYLKDFLIPKNGYSLKDLLILFDKIGGFSCKAVRTEVSRTKEALKYLDLPCIALMDIGNEGHYIIIYKINKNHLIISDPKNKKITKVFIDDFIGNFSGVFFTVKHEGRQKKDLERFNIFYFLITLLRKNYFILLTVFMLSVVFVFLSIVSSLFFKLVVDIIIPRELSDFLLPLTFVFLGINIIRVIFDYLRSTLVVRLSNKIDRILSNDFFEHIIALPIRFFENREDGEILSRFNDSVHIKNLVSVSIVTALLDLILITTLGVIIFLQNITIFLVVLAMFFMLSIISIIFYEYIEKNSEGVMINRAKTNSFLTEHLRNMLSVYSLNKKSYFLKKFRSNYEIQLKSQYKEQLILIRYNNLKVFIHTSFTILILFVGSRQILSDSMTLGDLLFINSLVTFLFSSLEGLIGVQTDLQKSKVALGRYLDIIKYPINKELSNKKKLEKVFRIELKKLTYGYQSKDNVLIDIDLVINGRENIVITGKSGVGKSTFAKILAKLYKVDDDSLYINQEDINKINEENIRESIVYLNEIPSLFKGSVRENLTMGTNYTDIKLETVSRLTKVKEIFNDNPKYLDFQLEENGHNLSSGQRQRVSLARSLLNEPSVLILDEALSNVDATLFEEIYSNLCELGMTIIIVTHIPESINNYDRKLIFKDNKIYEEYS